jgi:hypothetical protein
MTEGTFKVCIAGTSDPVEGTNPNMTEQEVTEWLLENQVYYDDEDPERPATDGSKYVVLPWDME